MRRSARLAGIIVGLVKLIALIEATAKATVALSVAMKANLIAHAETAYIKLLLLGDAIKAVTLAQAGMVAGAAAIGVGLGLLLRQIPGVADALDNFTIKVGQSSATTSSCRLPARRGAISISHRGVWNWPLNPRCSVSSWIVF